MLQVVERGPWVPEWRELVAVLCKGAHTVVTAALPPGPVLSSQCLAELGVCLRVTPPSGLGSAGVRMEQKKIYAYKLLSHGRSRGKF